MPGRPDQSSTRRNRRSSWIRGISLRLLGQPEVYCGCLAKRSPALQACNRARNSQADGVPKGTRAPEVQSLRSFFVLSVAGVYAWKTHLHPWLTLHATA